MSVVFVVVQGDIRSVLSDIHVVVAGDGGIGCTRKRLSPGSHQEIVGSITGQERGEEVSLCIGGGDDADGIGDDEGSETLFNGGDFGESNNELSD